MQNTKPIRIQGNAITCAGKTYKIISGEERKDNKDCLSNCERGVKSGEVRYISGDLYYAYVFEMKTPLATPIIFWHRVKDN